MKTNKAIASRFKVTGTGKLSRSKQGHKHILTKKSSKRKRSLKRKEILSPGFTKAYKKVMGV